MRVACSTHICVCRKLQRNPRQCCLSTYKTSTKAGGVGTALAPSSCSLACIFLHVECVFQTYTVTGTSIFIAYPTFRSDNESDTSLATPARATTTSKVLSSPTTPADSPSADPTSSGADSASTAGAHLLADPVKQLQQGGQQELVESLAKLVLEGKVSTQSADTGVPVSVAHAAPELPASVPKAALPSPPPAPSGGKNSENSAALAALPAAPPPPAPALAAAPAAPVQIETVNSATHPQEYKKFRKFCTEDSSAKELATAWTQTTQFHCILCVACACRFNCFLRLFVDALRKGGTFKMAAFAKYVRSGCSWDRIKLESRSLVLHPDFIAQVMAWHSRRV